MKTILPVLLTLLYTTELVYAGSCNTQNFLPRSVTFSSLTGESEMVGFAEFTDASNPKRYFKTCTVNGEGSGLHMPFHQYENTETGYTMDSYSLSMSGAITYANDGTLSSGASSTWSVSRSPSSAYPNSGTGVIDSGNAIVSVALEPVPNRLSLGWDWGSGGISFSANENVSRTSWSAGGQASRKVSSNSWSAFNGGGSGSVSYTLSNEDTPYNALEYADERGYSAATPGSSDEAYLIVSNNREVEAQTSRVTATFDKPCVGDYMLVMECTRGSGIVKTSQSVSVSEDDPPILSFELDIPLDSVVTKYKTIYLRSTVSCDSSSNEIGSIDWDLPLGNTINNESAGTVSLYQEQITAATYTPSVLTVSERNPEVYVIRDSNDDYLQIRTTEIVVDVNILTASSYELLVYPKGAFGDLIDHDSNPSTPMEYEIPNTNAWSAKYVFSDPGGSDDALQIDTTENGTTNTNTYTYYSSTDEWEFSEASGLRVKTLKTETVAGNTVETRTLSGTAGVAEKYKETIQEVTLNGVPQELTLEEVYNPDAVDGTARTTTNSYYLGSTSDPEYARKSQMIGPDGNWTNYYYDSQGRKSQVVTQYQNNSAPSATAAASAIEGSNNSTVYSYGTLTDTTYDSDSIDEVIETTVRSRLGSELARTYLIKLSEVITIEGIQYRDNLRVDAASAGAAWDATGNLITLERIHHDGLYASKPAFMVYPDGTATLYKYERYYTGALQTTICTGVPDSTTSPTEITDGVKTVRRISLAGNLTYEAVYDINSGEEYLISQQVTSSFDSEGRPLVYDYLDGTSSAIQYGCCGIEQTTDRAGNITQITYDVLGRETGSIQNLGSSNELIIENALDAAGRVTKTTLNPGTGEIVQSEMKYNPAGQIVWTKDALGQQTDYSRSTSGSFVVETMTFPGGSTSVSTSYKDGTLYEITGTAERGMRYTRAIEQDNSIDVETYTQTPLNPDGTTTAEHTKTFSDFLGRTYKVEHPSAAPGGGTATTTQSYNALGQLESETDADGIQTLYAYNGRGQQTVSAVDVDGDDQIDYDGTDRIVRTTTEVVEESPPGSSTDLILIKTTREVWETLNQDTPTTVLVQRQAVNSVESWSTQNDQTTNTLTVFDNQNQQVTTYTFYPDGTSMVALVEDGMLKSRTSRASDDSQLAKVDYAYDAFLRLSTMTDARNGTTDYTYFDDGRIETVTTPDPDDSQSGSGYDAQVTSYSYSGVSGGPAYESDGSSRTIVTLPDSETQTQITSPRGELTASWGARTNPSEYTYDALGRMKTLTTWQSFDQSAGNGLAGSAVTEWVYNDAGVLTEKRYNVTGPSTYENGPSYTYSAGGRLATRTWARGVVTTYAYDTATGDLTGVTYSDGTPAVSYTNIDRLGRPTTITDASGSRTLVYEDYALDSETYTAGTLSGFALDRSFDAQNRYTGFTLDAPGQTAAHAVTYGYSTLSGRMETVAANGLTTTYAYEPNSNLLASTTTNDGTEDVLTATRSWDKLNRLSGIETTKVSAQSVTDYLYTYNDADQRTRVTLGHAGDAYWDYGYDDLGQVIAGTKKTALGGNIPGYDLDYTFDAIGNRTQTVSNGATASWTPNALNQYSSYASPRAYDVLGTANNAATVTVNGQATSREGDIFYKQLDFSAEPNPNNAQWLVVDVLGTITGAGEGGSDAVALLDGMVYLPPNPVVPTYDADGNLLTDGRWSYTWNGENRLVGMETLALASTAGAPRQKLEFAYDNQGRRFSKKVSNWDGSAYVLESTALLIYDAWNMVFETTTAGSEARDKSYVWGQDVSGTLQGAGGVGGLLAVVLDGENLLPAYDGNGNVMAYVLASDGSLAAHYEYGPFGENLVTTGLLASELTYRFSTKYEDTASGLLYYGYRYYDSEQGRWPSRDPIGEQGGLNLYGFVGNDGVNWIDYTGLRRQRPIRSKPNNYDNHPDTIPIRNRPPRFNNHNPPKISVPSPKIPTPTKIGAPPTPAGKPSGGLADGFGMAADYFSLSFKALLLKNGIKRCDAAYRNRVSSGCSYCCIFTIYGFPSTANDGGTRKYWVMEGGILFVNQSCDEFKRRYENGPALSNGSSNSNRKPFTMSQLEKYHPDDVVQDTRYRQYD